MVVGLDGAVEAGESWVLRSGADWKVRPSGEAANGAWEPAASYGALASLGWRDDEALAGIGAFDEYNQWKEALGSAEKGASREFSELPEGFEIELVRVAGDEEGSWVSMAVLPEGDLLALGGAQTAQQLPRLPDHPEPAPEIPLAPQRPLSPP